MGHGRTRKVGSTRKKAKGFFRVDPTFRVHQCSGIRLPRTCPNPRSIEASQTMSPPTLKAFVLCDQVSDMPDSAGQKNLYGAGRSRFASVGPFPVKLSFWTFIQL